ncbi:MAG: glycogen/starch/alpha-glucan family phosphorylase [Clostridia bacterium]|nr:glycogen/starch/alpha-glucan family phosphorylase [Clostridia bacterium]
MSDTQKQLAEQLLARAESISLARYHHTLREADGVQLHEAISLSAMEQIAPAWIDTEKRRENHKKASYISMEYLIGRLVYNNLYCMGLLPEVKELLASRGIDLAQMEDVEDDAFGNGGLGRLAACFLDSAAAHDIPLTGYGLRYRYGLFRQTFEGGCQVAGPDDWSRFGDPWSIRRDDLSVVVPLKYGDVRAVPYDYPIIGYQMKSIGTLRLWQCESLHPVDFGIFAEGHYSKASADAVRAEDITRFLYPADGFRPGKMLRVTQEYVLSSASIQDMLRTYRTKHGSDYSLFPKEYAVQLNDTHPVLAIPELIRLLTSDGVSFDDALALAQKTFAYTNHTVMQEALETWDTAILRSLNPAIEKIIASIEATFSKERIERGYAKSKELSIMDRSHVQMAHLAVFGSHAVNGVAEIHSRILTDSLFSKWAVLYPERFQNKTNGITQRRWLGLCNPEYSSIISSRIGDGFMLDLTDLKKLSSQIDDDLIRDFRDMKLQKKTELARVCEKLTGIRPDPTMVFDVQVKRLHEYKRQFMNALSILAIYHGILSGKIRKFPPTAFIFGAKAFPGYFRAEAVIYLVHQIQKLVESNKKTSSLMKVIFLPNYSCSLAEVIMPAADISEQISPAGTEASGTGNMKFMLNGTVTLGTFDGANVEIVEEAGRQNNYIFGATVEELRALRSSYDPKAIAQENPVIHQVLEDLVDGTLEDKNGMLRNLYDSLLGTGGGNNDQYFVLQDFPSYLETKLRAIRDCHNHPDEFARKCLLNTAGAGKFSSDRTIDEYARDIWQIGPYEEA